MDIYGNILNCEREVSAYIDALTMENTGEAERLCTLLLNVNSENIGSNRAVSAAYARCLCRFLLHKKNKSKLIAIIKSNEIIRRAVFGSLNTYKYSLIFMLKRVFRQNDADLTKEVLLLLAANPFRDENAQSYSDRWSLDFLLRETLKAPADYLDLSKESLMIIKYYSKEGE